MKTITRDIYVAKDGKEFLKYSECEAYEQKITAYEFFEVKYNYDTEEGSLYQNSKIFAVNTTFDKDVYLKMYCDKVFGKYVWVQGIHPIEAYVIKKLNYTTDLDNVTFLDFKRFSPNESNIEDVLMSLIA